jgi:ribokinase
MKIINFGSLNIDHVYRVDHIARPGETVASLDYSLFAGGKGANQSIAIARAGGTVLHAGKIGYEGLWMVENMKKDGVDTSNIIVSERPTGHAIIQVDKKGQNSIVIYGGTNKEITTDEIDEILGKSGPDDLVLVQNEISNIAYIIEQAGKSGIQVCINPAPMGAEVFNYPLQYVSMFIINESEGEALTGTSVPEMIIEHMLRKYPGTRIILTRGARGAMYADAQERLSVGAFTVDVVDSTGAGDTFIGYFLTGLQEGKGASECLEMGSRAASISVTRKGAAASIPLRAELDDHEGHAQAGGQK